MLPDFLDKHLTNKKEKSRESAATRMNFDETNRRERYSLFGKDSFQMNMTVTTTVTAASTSNKRACTPQIVSAFIEITYVFPAKMILLLFMLSPPNSTIPLLISHANMNSNFTFTDYEHWRRRGGMSNTKNHSNDVCVWRIWRTLCMIWLQLFTLFNGSFSPLCLWNTIYLYLFLI